MRGQLNIRIDDGRKMRWREAAQRAGLELTAWMFLHLDAAARDSEQGALFEPPPREVAANGAYAREYME